MKTTGVYSLKNQIGGIPLKEQYLSIQKMAALRGLTAETLRHYDRIGLFRPDHVDPDTGYRYYSILQYEQLGTIKELRQLGLTLPEIQEYFQERSVQKSYELLRERLRILKEELADRRRTIKELDTKLTNLTQARAQIERGIIVEEQLPNRRIITFDTPVTALAEQSRQIVLLESFLIGKSPVLATERVGCISKDFSFLPGHFFARAPFLFLNPTDHVANSRSLVPHPVVREIPAGHFVCAHYNGKFGEYTDIYAQLSAYLRQNDYVPCGFFVQYYRIDVTVTDNFDETVMKVEIPVKPC
jgi:DNA-binding transcriptional MerR regulator